MRVSEKWRDYRLLDASDGERLELWGDVLLIRPDPQVIWRSRRISGWDDAHARYVRSSSGGGAWDVKKRHADKWKISYDKLKFIVSPTGFKHTGLFPEQAVNWDFITDKISSSPGPVSVINLFGYTGASTLAAAAAGAQVCHVDASSGMVAWARANAAQSGLSGKPVRWITDDCRKFVEREIRRGKRYDAVIMDPPSYGRGPSGEIWKLEDGIYELVRLCAGLLSENPLFFILNSYTTGLSPSVMQYILGITVDDVCKGRLSCSEIGLRVESTGQSLPCGSTAIWQAAKGESGFISDEKTTENTKRQLQL